MKVKLNHCWRSTSVIWSKEGHQLQQVPGSSHGYPFYQRTSPTRISIHQGLEVKLIKVVVVFMAGIKYKACTSLVFISQKSFL